MAAYGLYSHIESNKRRSIVLLAGLFGLVYLLVYAGALLAEAMSYQASLQYLLRKAWLDLLAAAPSDGLDDLFPGSGAVRRAGPHPPARRSSRCGGGPTRRPRRACNA